MDISNIQWHVEKPPSCEMVEVKVELTTPIEPDLTCHDLYPMLIKCHHIRKYPRRFKKAFFYGTKNGRMRERIRKEIYKYCVIETKE
jgi:hypothetical protein